MREHAERAPAAAYGQGQQGRHVIPARCTSTCCAVVLFECAACAVSAVQTLEASRGGLGSVLPPPHRLRPWSGARPPLWLCSCRHSEPSKRPDTSSQQMVGTPRASMDDTHALALEGERCTRRGL